jgi:hypothetical protein
LETFASFRILVEYVSKLIPQDVTDLRKIEYVKRDIKCSSDQPKSISTLSLAITTTNAPPGPNFTLLRPINHRVPPRPVILRRTSPPTAEKAALRAAQAAREAEKKAEAEKKEAEMEILRQAGEKARKLELGQAVIARSGCNESYLVKQTCAPYCDTEPKLEIL